MNFPLPKCFRKLLFFPQYYVKLKIFVSETHTAYEKEVADAVRSGVLNYSLFLILLRVSIN